MSGSYRHCRNGDRFQFDLIENMGDAHEACEHMYYMIEWLARGEKRMIQAAEQAAYDAMWKPHAKEHPAFPSWDESEEG